MRTMHFSCLAGIILTLGCGGGGGGESQPPALNPPSQVLATPLPTYGTFTVSWTSPVPSVDGYELEAKVGATSFQKVGTETIPPLTQSVTVNAYSTSPELTPIVFRLRSVRAGAFSPYSNEAPTKFPIRSASFLSANFNQEVMSLQWNKLSEVASTVRVEKAVLTSGSPGPYSLVWEGPATVTSTTDSNLNEDIAYRYRVTHLAQGESSVGKTVDSAPVPMLPPKITSGVSTSSGTTLQWQGVSSKAVQLQVQRGSGFFSPSYTTLASLPTGSSQYLDASVAAGFYSYRLVVKSATQTVYSSPFSMVSAPSGSGLTLSTSLKTLPWPIQSMASWTTTPSLLVAGTETASYLLSPSADAGWPSHTVYNATTVNLTSFNLDGQGRPHLLFRRRLGGTSSEEAVIHEWYDGANWNTQELFRGSIYGDSGTTGIRFALSTDGIVHAVWQPSSNRNSVWYGTNRSGTWESMQLPGTGDITNLGSMRVAVDTTGTTYIALGLWDKAILLTRPAGVSEFSQEEIPTGSISAGWYDVLELQPFGGKLALFYERFGATLEVRYLQMCLIKDQGAWGPPTELVARPHTGASTISRAVGTSTGRLAYAVNMPAGVQVFTLTPNQTWASTLLAPTGGYELYWVGFNNQNKFWAAVSGGWGPQSQTNVYAWYAE
ncbi:MAG: hypothetical protein IPL96_02205 [Holophagaceae bacterium]|nr:hypothetical protein [Holophagaceae bacterium]